MPRIKPVTDAGATAGGIWSTIDSLYDHRPESNAALKKLGGAIAAEGTLSPRLLELVRLRVGFHNQCRTCMAVRYQTELVSDDLVCSLERPAEADELTEQERGALRYADLLATHHLAIDGAVYDSLREHFDEGQIVELGMFCAFSVGFGRLLATWKVTEHLPEWFQSDDGIVTPWGHPGCAAL